MNAISALSPRRFSSLIIRVYPPGREATFSEISRNKIVIASLSFKYAKTVRRECVVSFFDFVIKGSTYLRNARSEEHTSELQSRENLVCRLLLEKKKKTIRSHNNYDIHVMP